jgi:hypothetical protein
MKTIQKTLLILLSCLFFSSISGQAQVKYFANYRQDRGISYDFFVGKDANDFQTTINGFGSGFIFDVFTGRYSVDFITVGPDLINLSLGVGVGITKYRFDDNLVITNVLNHIVYFADPDITHDYVNSFFGYGKSKLVYGSVYFPLNLNLSLGPFYLSAGGFIDLYASGKLKRKFLIDEEKQEPVLVRNEAFRDYPLNKTKYGINALILHKKSGLGLGLTYMITPFFQEGRGPELNEVRASITYKFSKFD